MLGNENCERYEKSGQFLYWRAIKIRGLVELYAYGAAAIVFNHAWLRRARLDQKSETRHGEPFVVNYFDSSPVRPLIARLCLDVPWHQFIAATRQLHEACQSVPRASSGSTRLPVAVFHADGQR